jgi:hypothetical protein
MAAKDEWKAQLRCPLCGKAGTASISEDDRYIRGDPHLRVNSVPEGFLVIPGGSSSLDTRILCGTCKVSAWS